MKILALALQITRNKCLKLTLTPVRDPADIYIYGLKEVKVSYASELGSFAALYPGPSCRALSGLAAAASKWGTLPVPSGLADSLQSSFLAGIKKA